MMQGKPKQIARVGSNGKAPAGVQIHFIWIDHFRCFNEQPFNLSGRYLFDLNDKSTQLTVRDNPRYVDGLWKHDNVLNVSALVGQNGAGKSTFLEFVRDTFSRFAGVPDPKVKRLIVAVEREGQGSVLFNHLDGDRLQIEDLTTGGIWRHCVPFPHDMWTNSVFSSQFDDMHFVYYSNEFNSGHLPSIRTDEGPNDHVHDLSTRYLILHDAIAFSNLPSAPPHPVIAHGNMEMLRNVDFALRCGGGESLLGFPLPDQLIMSPVRYTKADFPENLQDSFSQIKPAIRGEAKEGFLDRLALTALHNYAKDTHSPRVWDTLRQLLAPATTTFDAVIESFRQNSSAYGPAPRLRVELLEHCRDELPDAFFHGVGDWLAFSIRNASIKEQLMEFYALYSRSVMITPYVVERWNRPVSSGEQCLWNLYSRLWCFREGKPSERVGVDGPVVVLLDEADLYFHPKLQKELIARLLAFFKEAKVFSHNTVQVILTSNSPFCLSDIPRDHMIMLQAGENGRCEVLLDEDDASPTLGANIPDLLANEFFMGYSTMGDFARERIRSLIRWLKSEGEPTTGEAWLNPTVAWRLIQAIGEPLLRKRLEELYGKVAEQKQNAEMLGRSASQQGHDGKHDTNREKNL